MKKRLLIVNDLGDDPTPTTIDATWTADKDVVDGLADLAKGVALFGNGQMKLTATNVFYNGAPVPDAVYIIPLGFSSFLRNWILATKLMLLAFLAKQNKQPTISIRATNVTVEDMEAR